MRNWLFICAGLLVACISPKPEAKFILTGVGIPGEKMSLQQYQGGRIETVESVVTDSVGCFRFEYPCHQPALFFLNALTSEKNVELVVFPGEQTEVELTASKLKWKGDGVTRHGLVQKFREQKRKYEAEYPAVITDVANYRQRVEQQYKVAVSYLDELRLQEEEVKGLLKASTQIEYYGKLLNFPFFYQLISGKPAELPADYYSFLQRVDLSSPYLKYLGNSCSFLDSYFSALESQNYLESGKDDYLLKRAELIKDPGMRESYLLYVVDEVELFGYNQHLGKQLEGMQSCMLTSRGQAKMEEIRQKYEEMARQNTALNAGQKAFDFEGTDTEGKKHRLSDYKGKVVVVDVWNIGCKPCIAEIPYLKKLEQQFEDKDVVFISYSLDTQVESWKQFLGTHRMEGNQWINTEAFKSDFARDYKVRFIPRFMVFGKNGEIVEVYAPRPSNPRLAKLIEEELKK